MITDDDIYPLLDEAQSIATCIKNLCFMAKDMAITNPELFDYQKPALDQLRIIQDYTRILNEKCTALLASTEQGTPLSAQEQQILNEWVNHE